MRVTVEPYGEAAFEALDRAVAGAQGGDPLRRVTVVVPRGAAKLATRRRLASRGCGIANVQCATFSDLAGELAAGWLATTDRRPLTSAVLHEAVRAMLSATDRGPLASTRDQPAAVRAATQTYRELRGVPASSLRAIAAQGDRAGEVVRLVAAIDERLASWYDDADLVTEAAAAVRAAPGDVVGTGPVVVYLPAGLGPADLDLLDALASAAAVPVSVIVGSTGDAVADRPAKDLAHRVGGDPEDPGFTTPVVHGTRVVAAPSADAEVLVAVRHLMARHAAGVPLERLALAHGGNPPYPRLLHDTLDQAGIPSNGAGIRPLSATVAGRTLLGALGLPDQEWRRDAVVTWLTTAPLLDRRGRPVPASAWDAASRASGVVRGLDEWRERLAAHAATLRSRAALDDELAGGHPSSLHREADRCEALWDFVEHVAEELREVPRTWVGWAAWARRFLRELLGEGPRHSDWPASEVAALDAVHEAVQGLALLGSRSTTASEARAALAVELEATAPQTSRFGHGVLVGRVDEMVGLDLEVLYVVGMVDGAFPSPITDDVLLPDRERQAVGDVPLRGSRPADARRAYLGALAAAHERVLSFAVGDQRRGREQRPARLLLDTIGALSGAGRRVFVRDLPAVGGYEEIPSYAAAVAARGGEPASAEDWDLRSLVGWVERGGSAAGHFLARADPVLAAGLELRRGRRRDTFTRFDGRVDDLAATPPAAGRTQSATSLEAYARCPRRYLFDAVLRIEVREPPEAVLRIHPIERGTIVHRVLERFVAERPAGEPVDPSVPWGPAGEERLAAIAEEVCDDFERRGLAGRPSLWRIDRAAILGELRHFLREDDRYRRETGASPLAVEQAFGHHGEPGVTVPLADGRRVEFRGTVDRIDRTAGGGLSVLDYKTGRRPDPGEDPVAGGTRLQLPLYALAARERYRTTGQVDARYWYVSDRGSDRGRYPREGFTVTPETERRLADVVGALVDGVEHGRFPGNPDGCALCPFDGICPPDRVRSWERKLGDPWLAPYRELAGIP